MGQYRLVRRAAAGAAAFEQARLEPAAMLVAAFEVKVGAVGRSVAADQSGPFAAFEQEGVGAARIEPDVDDVGDAPVIGRCISVAPILLRAAVHPRLDPGGPP